MRLEKRWTKCVDIKGDYVEKQNSFFIENHSLALLGREIFSCPHISTGIKRELMKFGVKCS